MSKEFSQSIRESEKLKSYINNPVAEMDDSPPEAQLLKLTWEKFKEDTADDFHFFKLSGSNGFPAKLDQEKPINRRQNKYLNMYSVYWIYRVQY